MPFRIQSSPTEHLIPSDLASFSTLPPGKSITLKLDKQQTHASNTTTRVSRSSVNAYGTSAHQVAIPSEYSPRAKALSSVSRSFGVEASEFRASNSNQLEEIIFYTGSEDEAINKLLSLTAQFKTGTVFVAYVPSTNREVAEVVEDFRGWATSILRHPELVETRELIRSYHNDEAIQLADLHQKKASNAIPAATYTQQVASIQNQTNQKIAAAKAKAQPVAAQAQQQLAVAIQVLATQVQAIVQKNDIETAKDSNKDSTLSAQQRQEAESMAQENVSRKELAKAEAHLRETELRAQLQSVGLA